MATSVVFPRVQFFANNGRPLIGGSLHTYVAGSSTRARTYKDAAKAQPNANPIILDARGEASVYLADGVEYKFVIEDSTGALIMTQEPVYGAIWPNADEWPSDATLSYKYMTEAKAAADTIGPIKFFDTKAQADAAIGTMANGDIIEVSQDETRAGARTRYKVQAGALVFVVNLDQVRVDLAGANGAGLMGFLQSGTGAVERTAQEKMRESVSVDDFGAVEYDGTDATDATAAFQKAIDAISNAGGGTVRWYKRHLINGNLAVKDNVSLKGPLGQPDELLPARTADYDSLQGVLIINPAATVTVLDSASILNGIAIRKGLDLPFADATAATKGVAAFAGTAFTVGGAGAYFGHLLVLGFNKAIYSSRHERVRCEYVSGDCTNGIDIRACFDISYVHKCHFWPWTTTHQSWSSDALWVRSGYAFQFKDGGDWNKWTDCFSYGYKNGYIIDSCSHVNVIGCGADYVGGGFAAADVIGFWIKGTSQEACLIGTQSAAQGVGVLIDTTAAIKNAHRITSHDSWDGTSASIEVKTGRAALIGCTHSGGSGAAIRLWRGTAGVIVGCSIEDIGSGIVGNAGFDYATTWTSFGNYAPAGAPSGVAPNRFASEILSYGGVSGRSMRSEVTGVGEPVYQWRRTDAPADEKLWEAIVTSANEDWNLRAVSDSGAAQSAIIVARGAGAVVSELLLCASGGNRFGVNSGGFIPKADNAYTIGDGSFRPSVVYAVTGTINTSDVREKEGIANSVLGLAFINSLRPVSYKWKAGRNEVIETEDEKIQELVPVPGKRTHWGLIAQEVKHVVDAAGVDFAGWTMDNPDDPESRQGLRYDQFVAPLIKAVQELTARLEALEANNP